MTNRIREFRKKKKLNQEQLAAEVGVDTSTISRLETGKRGKGRGGAGPTYSLITRIAEALDTTPDDLLDAETLASARENETAAVRRVPRFKPSEIDEEIEARADFFYQRMRQILYAEKEGTPPDKGD